MCDLLRTKNSCLFENFLCLNKLIRKDLGKTRMASCVENLYKNDPFASKSEITTEDIDYLYVPFDDLIGIDVENGLLCDLKKSSIGKFYALIGDSGYGKSSILNYILVKLATEGSKTFCIKLNEFPIETKNDPRILLTHILKMINKMSQQFTSLGGDERMEIQKLLAREYTFTSMERKKICAKLQVWINVIPALLGVKGDIGGEIEKQSGVVLTGEKDLGDLIVFINQLVTLIKRYGFEHVLIMIDETDKITDSDGYTISWESAVSFFNAMLPVLQKTNCSYLFVLNSQYDNPTFKKQILSKFDRQMSIPKIDKIKGIGKIIEKRTKAVCDSMPVDSIWESGTFDELFKFYKKTSLRSLSTACRLSVEKARKIGATVISINSVKEAILDSR